MSTKREQQRALAALAALPPIESLVISPDEYDLAPTADLILVEHQTHGDSTDGGIVIPEIARQRWMPRSVVRAVGPGRITADGVLVAPRLKVGDRVLLAPQHGAVFELPGGRLALVEEKAVIAVVTPKSPLAS